MGGVEIRGLEVQCELEIKSNKITKASWKTFKVNAVGVCSAARLFQVWGKLSFLSYMTPQWHLKPM